MKRKNNTNEIENPWVEAYTFFCWILLTTIIAMIWVCTLGQSIMIVQDPSWATKICRILFTFAMGYLQVVNTWYWFLGINLFDFKKIFKNKKNE